MSTKGELPTEQEQYEAYRTVAEHLDPRPVIFRTMDLGGDKVASYMGMTHETNPFLGWRGIRFALHHPEVFRSQIRALYRASAVGKVKIMFPLVSSEEELLGAIDMCKSVARNSCTSTTCTGASLQPATTPPESAVPSPVINSPRPATSRTLSARSQLPPSMVLTRSITAPAPASSTRSRLST